MRDGSIITFYSYKGGVGRSFALANIAAALARWGFKVLCVDWDLEAPGLSEYFAPWLNNAERGLIDLVLERTRTTEVRWKDYVTTVALPESENSIDLLLAGGGKKEYVDQLHSIAWDDLYEKHDFGAFLEQVRTEWKATYDFVLVDSRTGISDSGGICTVQLPDILVFVLSASSQSLNGAVEVVTRAKRARDRLPYDRAALLTFPIISRFDSREEYEKAQQWRTKFIATLAEFFGSWASASTKTDELIDLLTIPYFAYWSFGEELPVVIERDRGRESISYHLEGIAALLAHRLAQVDVSLESPRRYVEAARKAGVRAKSTEGIPEQAFPFDVFISYSHDDSTVARSLSEQLKMKGLKVARVAPGTGDVNEWYRHLRDALDMSKHLVVLLHGRISPGREAELKRFLKQTVEEGSSRSVVPILLEGAQWETFLPHMPPLLRNIRYIEANEASLDRAANEVVAALRH